jgi:hypothetical protein
MARASGARSSDRVFFPSRLAPAVGFGGLRAIMALAGIDALNVLHRFRRSDDRLRRRYLSQNHVLNDIRFDVYVSGTYVRDYLLESDAMRADTLRGRLEEVRRRMESSLESYRHEVAPREAKHYSALRAELMDYWGILAPIFKWARISSKSTSMDVTVKAELDSDELPDEYKTCVYRMVQEALLIQDDGQGFDVQETKGMGLLGIEGTYYPPEREMQDSLAAGTRQFPDRFP